MKKRMWLWCLIAAFGLSFSVACSDDDEKDVTPTPPVDNPTPTPPVEEPTPSQTVIVVDTMEVTANIDEVPYVGGTITFTTTTNQTYTVASTADWITIDSDGRALTATYTVTATVAANEGEAREGKITVTFDDAAKTVKEVVVKQAAYVAPTPEPTPEPTPAPETETVTVTLNIIPGATGTTVSAEEVATKLGVEDLAAAIADGSVTYVGLNADGTVYTLEDGSTPSSTTNATGHWYNTECNPISWGTPDPAGTGAVRFAYLEGDGASFNLGYDNSGALVAGEYKIAGKYIYGDAEVIFQVVINVDEAPESSFVAPEADYTLNVKVVQDNGWGATYIALDGTDVTGWSKYEDAAAYVTPVSGVSVDITSEIEAALGIADGTLEDELLGGGVLLGSYNANNEFMDCYSVKGSNYFFWFAEDGAALSSYAGFACIDNLGFVGEDIRLYGTTCLMPNTAIAGTTYNTYIVFRTEAGDAEYVVKVAQEAVETPEAIVDETVYEIVDEFTAEFETSYAAGYGGGTHVMDAGIVADMATLIEIDDLSNATYQMLNAAGEVVEDVNGLGGTNGWYGVDGPASWGNGSIVFLNKDGMSSIDSWAYGCHPDVAVSGDVVTVKIQFRNAASAKAVNYFVTITVVD